MEMFRNALESLEKDAAQADRYSTPTEESKRALLFDRDPVSRAMFAACLPEEFYSYACSSAEEVASELLARKGQKASFDLLVWSLGDDVEDDLRTLRELREIQDDLKIVLLASQESLAYAAQIRAAEAETLILKPLRAQDVRFGLEKAMKSLRVTTSAPACLQETKPQQIPQLNSFPGSDLGLIGDSPEMRKIISLIRKVGPSSVSVLITGESGTGKEMVANALHKVSDRNGKPFVALNCAAIPKELLESELFGHAKGAFTGATSARKGLFEEAHEGTILLDEIGDLPLPLQAKILRLIQTREVKAVGQNSVKTVNVRIVSATH
jgi:DNA-binding NtrC family response regulator